MEKKDRILSLSVQKAETGEKGDRGEAGPRGPSGADVSGFKHSWKTRVYLAQPLIHHNKTVCMLICNCGIIY